MAKKIYININNKIYHKPIAEQKFKDILHSYKEGDVVGIDDSKFIEGVLLLHPEADKKIGCGIDRFEIVEDFFGNYNRIEIVRIDGSRQDFSYKKCFNGKNLQKRMK